MKAVIRADAYATLGTGHVMRCIALGQGIQDSGGEVIFISYCDSEGLVSRLRNEGFNLHLLYEAGCLPETLKLIKEEKPDWVVLDGYHFDAAYQKAVKDAGYKLMVIDDYAHLDCYHADIIMNQNYGAEKIHYNAAPHAKLLLGTKYAMLRREFRKLGRSKRGIPEIAEKLLITMGGADKANHTLRVLKAVNLIDRPLTVKVVLGAANSYCEILAKEAEGSRHRIEILKDVEDMPHLMSWAEAAVSAGGSTVWELAYMELPSLLCIVADNQAEIVNMLARAAAFHTVGWVKDIAVDSMADCLSRLLFNKAVRSNMRKSMHAMVDGKGTGRIYSNLDCCENIRLRPASLDDAGYAFEWRNHPEVRNNCFDQSPMQWEKHREWFENVLSRSDRVLLVAEVEGRPTGVLRYDILKQAALVSLYLNPEMIGRGIGPSILRLGNDWLKTHNPLIRRVIAEIKAGNAGSARAFQKAGYRESHTVFVCDL